MPAYTLLPQSKVHVFAGSVHSKPEQTCRVYESKPSAAGWISAHG